MTAATTFSALNTQLDCRAPLSAPGAPSSDTNLYRLELRLEEIESSFAIDAFRCSDLQPVINDKLRFTPNLGNKFRACLMVFNALFQSQSTRLFVEYIDTFAGVDGDGLARYAGNRFLFGRR